jgi:4-hydroxybenzoate polyprenyltransferase
VTHPLQVKPLGSRFAVKSRISIVQSRRDSLYSVWTELRPQQWTKNLLVLAPLLFSQNILNSTAVLQAATAFGLFCLVSSSVYLFNDIKDRHEDSLHPLKCHRPLAAGMIDLSTAWTMAAILLVVAFTGAAMVNRVFFLILAGYCILNVLYSVWLKHVVILDVFVVACGFLLRVAAGGAAIHVEISHWILICTTLLALFLSFAKRRHELLLLGQKGTDHRHVLHEYDAPFLDMMIGIVTASTVMSYALYTVSEETIRRFHTKNLVFTLPFVLYGIFRYLYLVYHKNHGGDPTQSLLTDWPILINILLWAMTAAILITY